MTQSPSRASGFGSRFFAVIIDALVLFPFALLLGKLIQWPGRIPVLGALIYGIMFPAYHIVLLGLFGQTVGKKIAGLRVELIDGGVIRWRQAFLRHAVDLCFALILIGGWISVLSEPRQFQNAKYYTLLKPELPFFIWGGYAWTAWIWSELIVMFLNRRRRAFHDFIAGTWVVQRRVTASKPIALS
jgi:uncharacterized RDD family membrane protein YckC